MKATHKECVSLPEIVALHGHRRAGAGEGVLLFVAGSMATRLTFAIVLVQS